MRAAQKAWGPREDSSEALTVGTGRDRIWNWLRLLIGMSMDCLQDFCDNDAMHAKFRSPP